MRELPLTNYPGLERSPPFKPDGRQIAFFWVEGRSPAGLPRFTTGRDERRLADLQSRSTGSDVPLGWRRVLRLEARSYASVSTAVRSGRLNNRRFSGNPLTMPPVKVTVTLEVTAGKITPTEVQCD